MIKNWFIWNKVDLIFDRSLINKHGMSKFWEYEFHEEKVDTSKFFTVFLITGSSFLETAGPQSLQTEQVHCEPAWCPCDELQRSPLRCRVFWGRAGGWPLQTVPHQGPWFDNVYPARLWLLLLCSGNSFGCIYFFVISNCNLLVLSRSFYCNILSLWVWKCVAVPEPVLSYQHPRRPYSSDMSRCRLPNVRDHPYPRGILLWYFCLKWK